MRADYGSDLDSLLVGDVVGLCIESDNSLHLYINNVDQGIAVKDVPKKCHAVVDVYGQCEQVCTQYVLHASKIYLKSTGPISRWTLDKFLHECP